MPVTSNNKLAVSIAQVHTLVSEGPLDICKTPAPPAPVPPPIPYPNIAVSATPGPGYTTKTLVLATPAVTKNSKIALSNGDQPGVAMGVISGRIMGMAQAVSSSSDVAMEGGNLVRTLDKGESNMGSPSNDKLSDFISAAATLGISEAEAEALCKAFCEVQAEYDAGKISGPGCCSKALEQRLNALNNPNILTEQSYMMINGAAPQMLSPSVFNSACGIISGTRAFNFVSGIVGSAAGVAVSAGGSVVAAAGVRLSRALRVLGCGHVCRPDVILQRGAQTRVFDAKFRWRNGQDALSAQQKKDYPKIDSTGQCQELNNEVCGCASR